METWAQQAWLPHSHHVVLDSVTLWPQFSHLKNGDGKAPIYLATAPPMWTRLQVLRPLLSQILGTCCGLCLDHPFLTSPSKFPSILHISV